MNPVAIAVDDLREQYTREMALVRQTAERTGDGTAAIRRRSAVVDRILIEMWRRAFAELPAQNVALLALGGYGRKDLFPYSDIDVLFAFADDKTEEKSREAVRAVIQGMWDIGLRASPSSRTVKESGRFDPDNLEFTLATLDRRFLTGQFPLYQQLHQVTFPGLVLSEWNNITQKLGEIARSRHAKFGNTIFHLEPNLKDCPGGLRDYHLAVWFAILFQLKETKEWPRQRGGVFQSARGDAEAALAAADCHARRRALDRLSAARVAQLELAEAEVDRLRRLEHRLVKGDRLVAPRQVRLVDAIAQVADQTAAATTVADAVDRIRGQQLALLQLQERRPQPVAVSPPGPRSRTDPGTFPSPPPEPYRVTTHGVPRCWKAERPLGSPQSFAPVLTPAS